MADGAQVPGAIQRMQAGQGEGWGVAEVMQVGRVVGRLSFQLDGATIPARRVVAVTWDGPRAAVAVGVRQA